MTDQLGRPTPLIEGRAKVTGATRFTADMNRADMLHARLVTSVYAHANLRGIDSRAALKVSGVVAVLTAEDMPKIAPSSRSSLLLARERVIFAGQPIAMVVATTEAAAEDGARQVMVDYDPLPTAITIDEALADNAPLVWPLGVPSATSDAGSHGAATSVDHASQRKASNVAGEEKYQRGDVEKGFAEAEVIVEHTFTTPIVHHSSVEPHSVAAEPNAENGGVTVWASTQAPFDMRKSVAKVLRIRESDVRLIAMAVGGGFGGKNGLYEPLIAAAACVLNRGVILTLTRSEEMLAANPAPPTRIHLRVGAKRDGTLTALTATVHLDDGCYPFDLAGFLAIMTASFYRVPNFMVHGVDVLTFKPSVGPYRAPGAPSVIFALDSVIDELAQKLKIDPLEVRLRNAVRGGDLMASDDAWPTIGMTQVLETLRDHPAWKNRDEARAKGYGVGISVGGWPGGTEPAAAACSLNRDGVLQIQVGSVDLNGTNTGFTLMAAEVFGVSPEQVRVIFSDTDTAPYSGPSAGSKVTYATGAAVVQAAREARRQVLQIASEELEVSVEDLEIVDGAVRVRGVPNKTIALTKIASSTMRFSGKYAPVFAHGRVAETETAPAFSAQLAEVEVDRETGEVKLHRLVIVQDVGKAINPLAIEGQMMGGATQGIGWALHEQMIYDSHGQLLSGTWLDYIVPRIQHTPQFETVIIEVPSERGPLGVRGVGETPVVPTAAAIANAIADSIGARLTDLPMTPPRVLAAIRNKV